MVTIICVSPCSASRLEQLGDELKSSRVNAVIGFLRSDKARQFRGARQPRCLAKFRVVDFFKVRCGPDPIGSPPTFPKKMKIFFWK